MCFMFSSSPKMTITTYLISLQPVLVNCYLQLLHDSQQMKAVSESSHSLLLATPCLSDPFLQKQRLGGGKQGKGLVLKVHVFQSPSRSWLSWGFISCLSSPTSVSIETSQQHRLSHYPEVFSLSRCWTWLGKLVEDNDSIVSVLRFMLLASHHVEAIYIK